MIKSKDIRFLARVFFKTGLPGFGRIGILVSSQMFSTWIWIQWSFEHIINPDLIERTWLPALLLTGIRLGSGLILAPVNQATELRIRRLMEYRVGLAVNNIQLDIIQKDECQSSISRIRRYGISTPVGLVFELTQMTANAASLCILARIFSILPWWLPLTWIIAILVEYLIAKKISRFYHHFISCQTPFVRKAEQYWIWITQPQGLADLRQSGHCREFARQRSIILKQIDQSRIRFTARIQLKRSLLRIITALLILPGLFYLINTIRIKPEMTLCILVVSIRSWQVFKAIARSITLIHDHLPFLHEATEFLSKYQDGTSEPPCSSKVQQGEILMNELSYAYPGQGLLLNRLNMKINKGELVLIKGDNGAGKTTFARILAGQLVPQSGLIEKRSRVGLLSQDFARIEGRITDHISPNQSTYHEIFMTSCLRKSGFEKIMKAKKLILSSHIGLIFDRDVSLSDGEWQLLALARALYGSRIIVLDEPDAFLDKQHREHVKQTILALKNDITCIIITHHNEYDSLASRIFRLDGGKLTIDQVQSGNFFAADAAVS